jgi:hypothetical protein
MGLRIKAPFLARVRGGGVLTFQGTASDQAVYWYMEAQDPREGEGPWPPVGTLGWEMCKTRKDRCATNMYFGPLHLPRIRVGMHYKVGECFVGMASGLWDKLYVMCGMFSTTTTTTSTSTTTSTTSTSTTTGTWHTHTTTTTQMTTTTSTTV